MTRIAIILLLLVSAGCKGQQADKLSLFLPAADTSLSFQTDPRNILTLVPRKDNIIYYSNELKSAEQVRTAAYAGLKKTITAFKQSIGDSIVIMIKPAEDVGYKNIIDVLDQMSINNIKRYALLDLTGEEEKILGLKGFMSLQEETVSPPPVKVKAVEPVYDLAFYIEGDGRLFYSEAGRDKAVNIAVTKEEIVRVIGQVEKKLNKKAADMVAIVEGNKSLEFKKLQPLLDAMKEKNLYKFQLISKD